MIVGHAWNKGHHLSDVQCVIKVLLLLLREVMDVQISEDVFHPVPPRQNDIIKVQLVIV